MMKHGQPYLGAFLLKDLNGESEVITDINSVHQVGVFAQITSILGASRLGEKYTERGLTVVVYAHRRIKITELVKAGPKLAQDQPKIVEPPTPPSPPPERQVVEQKTVQTDFLRNHDISIVNVQNLITIPYNKDNPRVGVLASEIGSVLSCITRLNPFLLDQMTNFSMNQGGIFSKPDELADFAVAVTTGDIQALRDVLESLDVVDRLSMALLILKKELRNVQMQNQFLKIVHPIIPEWQHE